MKTKIKLVLLVCLFTGMAMQAQEIDISGDWTMHEMTWTSGDEVNTTTEDQLKAEGMFSDYFFISDGKLKMVSNMTGSGNIETFEGTWKLEGDQLTYSISFDGNLRDFVWGFDFKDDMIYLQRSSPDGSTTVVNSFKRK